MVGVYYCSFKNFQQSHGRLPFNLVVEEQPAKIIPLNHNPWNITYLVFKVTWLL